MLSKYLVFGSNEKISYDQLSPLCVIGSNFIKPAAGDLVLVSDGDGYGDGDLVEVTDGEGGEEDIVEWLGAGLELDRGAGVEEISGVHNDEVQAGQLAQDYPHRPNGTIPFAPGGEECKVGWQELAMHCNGLIFIAMGRRVKLDQPCMYFVMKT
jgi:hypothetical protein